VRMPFRKHRGQALSALPLDYLRWLHSLDDLREPLRGEVLYELFVRRSAPAPERPSALCPDRQLAARVIDAGRRALAKQFHPDVGGSHAAFLKLTEVTEWLAERAR